MITARAFAGKTYAVLGLARSGVATVDALLASGAKVVAWDSNPEARNALVRHPGEGRDPRTPGSGEGAVTPESLGPGLRRDDDLVLADPLETDLSGYEAVIVSPGIPLNRHPIAAHAARYGVPIIGDIELFAQARAELPPHKVVGITGTNGKSTTTALVHHILETAGIPSLMGGNIGLPILSRDPLPEGGVYVLELSSYQIDLTRSLDCDVAVLLNITPDHLDRYDGSFDAYIASKVRLFEMQAPTHVGVTTDDPASGEVWERLFRYTDRKSAWAFTTYYEDLGVAVWEGEATLTLSNDPFAYQRDWPALQGPHNAQNAAAAIAVTDALGVDPATIAEALRTYTALPHRMQAVRTLNDVIFLNDSKATNPDSTAPALAAYPDIHWIVGGKAKSETLGPCEAHLAHVRGAYTIGESGPMFARLLHEKGVPALECVELDVAVKAAAQAARPGEVVLLSPACASFDQFRDFEARGDAFRAAVEAL